MFQLLQWNGSLKAMRERQCSRQEVNIFRNSFCTAENTGQIIMSFIEECQHYGRIMTQCASLCIIRVFLIWDIFSANLGLNK